jgi:hypothetical protein
MTSTTNTTVEAATSFASAWLSLAAMVRGDAAEAQWQPGQTPQPREDTTERSRGMVADPTYNIAVDGRRVELRGAVVQAEHTLADSLKMLRELNDHLRSRVAALDATERPA